MGARRYGISLRVFNAVAHNCHGKTKSHGTTKFTYGKTKLTHGKTKFTYGKTEKNKLASGC